MHTSTQATLKSEPVFFYILIRSWEAFSFFDQCVDSVLKQTYPHFQILFVDDASDYTTSQKNHIKKKLKDHVVQLNTSRKYSVQNAYEMIKKYGKNEDGIVISLDGDDWLIDKNVLKFLSDFYQKKLSCWFTYGDCLLWNNQQLSKQSASQLKTFTNVPYMEEIIHQKSFRKEPFLPLHLRTWKIWLFNKIPKTEFLHEDGSWFQYCEDMVIYFPLLEMASDHYKVITRPLSIYNQSNPQSDIHSLIPLIKDELEIRARKPLPTFVRKS